MKCIFGHKLGKVENDGYQYCRKCGKAFAAPCKHRYKLIAKYQIDGYVDRGQYPASILPNHFMHVYQCEYCGESYKERIV